jgi:hypothetical protein
MQFAIFAMSTRLLGQMYRGASLGSIGVGESDVRRRSSGRSSLGQTAEIARANKNWQDETVTRS